MNKLLIIDSNSIAYRAFYALPESMITASGQTTNAVFGFISTLIKLWREHDPDQIVVAFDRAEPTFRHKIAAEYKATRAATPDSLHQQLNIIRDVLEVLALPAVDAVGYEADDVAATLATEGRNAGHEVIIASGDQDIYQLVEDPLVKVLYCYTKQGKSHDTIYDESGIKQRTGVLPADYVAYAALRGDNSDNLPGVPGVGEKTASKLINDHGNIDGVFASLDTIRGPKLRENLAATEQRVRSNVKLMQLVRDVPLGVSLENLQIGTCDIPALNELFNTLEFRSLKHRLAKVLGDDSHSVSITGDRALEPVIAVLDTVEKTEETLTTCLDRRPLALAVPAEGLDAGLALVVDSAAYKVVFIPGRLLNDTKVADSLANLMAGHSPLADQSLQNDNVDEIDNKVDSEQKTTEQYFLALHDAKEVMRTLLDRDIDIRARFFDTMLVAYLLNPSARRYTLKDLATRYTDLKAPSVPSTEGQGKLNLDDPTNKAAPINDTAYDAAWSALAVDQLVTPMWDELKAQGLDDLYNKFEMPLVRVLARMEHVGINVDRGMLERIRDKLTTEAEELREQIVAVAGTRKNLNVNSPKQLSEVLFGNLKLTPIKKNKTAFSTDAQTLELLRGQHPIISHILEYREVEKLRSTYGEGLIKAIKEDGRIHATFNQTVARTGRLSSDDPNLHNIPIRTQRGREFRAAFKAPSNCLLLIADYDQIELRCIAHLSKDRRLIDAFESAGDIHITTAAWLFDITPKEVDTQKRSIAKMVSYGLIYGMEAYGLSRRLNISANEAAKLIEDYFSAFPDIRTYLDRTIEEARERGYAETLFGRRRRIPELRSSNQHLRQAGERQATNTGVQGLAADIFKMALINLDQALETRGLESRIVLQVHDEIILEVSVDEREVVSQLVLDEMCGVCELLLPLEVHLKIGETWTDAKDSNSWSSSKFSNTIPADHDINRIYQA